MSNVSDEAVEAAHYAAQRSITENETDLLNLSMVRRTIGDVVDAALTAAAPFMVPSKEQLDAEWKRVWGFRAETRSRMEERSARMWFDRGVDAAYLAEGTEA